MSIGGVSSDVPLSAMIKLGEEAGLNRASCRKTIARIAETISSANVFFKKANIPARVAKPIIKELEEGLPELRLPALRTIRNSSLPQQRRRATE